MKATDNDVRDALLGGAARKHGDRAGCPPSEDLVRAAEGGPAGPAIVDHLAQCPDCALEFRLASSLKPWAQEAAFSLPGGRPVKDVQPARARAYPLALAASLAACMVLGGWTLTLRQQAHRLDARLADAEEQVRRGEAEAALRKQARDEEVTSLRRQAEPFAQPHANVPLVDLFPDAATRGSGGATPTVDPSGSPFVVLILNVRALAPRATYEVEIRDAGGHVVWAGDRAQADGEPLTLGVPSHLLSGDAYRIRLYQIRGDRRTLVEEYALRVRRGEGGPRP